MLGELRGAVRAMLESRRLPHSLSLSLSLTPRPSPLTSFQDVDDERRKRKEEREGKDTLAVVRACATLTSVKLGLEGLVNLVEFASRALSQRVAEIKKHRPVAPAARAVCSFCSRRCFCTSKEGPTLPLNYIYSRLPRCVLIVLQ